MCKDDKYISLECDTFEALKEDFDKIMNDISEVITRSTRAARDMNIATGSVLIAKLRHRHIPQTLRSPNMSRGEKKCKKGR